MIDERSFGRDAAPGPEVLILIPVFNDWKSLSLLLPAIDRSLSDAGYTADVLVVNDASTVDPDGDLFGGPWKALRRVDVLGLLRNLGHQRAIAVGLAFVGQVIGPGAVVVMDGDGEDDPADIPRLLDRMKQEGYRKIVFAERAKRSEALGFRIGYRMYKFLHKLLTGVSVRVGNFSAIPARRLASLAVVSELWNHYAAAVFRSKQPYCTVPTRRASRLAGRSSMNYVALVTHGLSAISIFGDIVGVRLLVFAAGLAGVSFVGLMTAIVVRLTTSLAIPGWATFAAGLSLVLLVQAILLMSVFSFVILAGRQGSSFLPRRDYAYFVAEVRPLAAPTANPREGTTR